MSKAKDHENYEYIDIIVKKDNADEVVASYGEFLWKEISRKEDKIYSDVLHVSFYRAHNIQNKDRLQLLQVYYEFALNERAEAFEKKHHKSKAGICNLIVLSACLLVGIWWLIFYMKNIFAFVGGICFSLIIVLFALLFGRKLKKLHKEENQRFAIKDQEQKTKIEQIIKQVKTLTNAKVGGEL